MFPQDWIAGVDYENDDNSSDKSDKDYEDNQDESEDGNDDLEDNKINQNEMDNILHGENWPGELNKEREFYFYTATFEGTPESANVGERSGL